MYKRNKRGPRTVSWDTPDRSGASGDLYQSTTTDWLRHVSHCVSQLLRTLAIVAHIYWFRRRWCATESKAFKKSMKSVCSPLSREAAISSTVEFRWVSHENFSSKAEPRTAYRRGRPVQQTTWKLHSKFQSIEIYIFAKVKRNLLYIFHL